MTNWTTSTRNTSTHRAHQEYQVGRVKWGVAITVKEDEERASWSGLVWGPYGSRWEFSQQGMRHTVKGKKDAGTMPLFVFDWLNTARERSKTLNLQKGWIQS